jgi:hypothetical protein
MKSQLNGKNQNTDKESNHHNPQESIREVEIACFPGRPKQNSGKAQQTQSNQ